MNCLTEHVWLILMAINEELTLNSCGSFMLWSTMELLFTTLRVSYNDFDHVHLPSPPLFPGTGIYKAFKKIDVLDYGEIL